MTHLDLFSGIGGFAIAAQACGFRTVAFCEIDFYAQQVLIERFGAVLSDPASRGLEKQGLRHQDIKPVGVCPKHGEVQNEKEKFGAVYAQSNMCLRPPSNVPHKRNGKVHGSNGHTNDTDVQVPEVHDNQDGQKTVAHTECPSWIYDPTVPTEQGKTGMRGLQGQHPVIHPDIFALNGADYLGVDLVTGGFPCQPYSCAGKRRGAEDHRAIWPEMRRIIAEARPAWVLGENVPGIINMELDRVLSDLEAIGYACWPLVIPACAVDARHRRDRVWIVARRNDEVNVSEWKGKLQRSKQRAGDEGGMEFIRQGGIASHARCELLEGREAKPEEVPVEWLPEPDVGRVAHGIPARAHRLRALGNAIVPKVAEVIIREIARLINHDFPVRIETNKPNSL